MDTKVLIFDWDGTLMDSASRIIACVQRAANDLSTPAPPAEAIRAIIGLSFDKALPQLFPLSSPEIHRQIRERYREHFFHNDPTPMALFSGIKDLLDDCRSAGFLLAVATGKSRIGLNHVLDTSGLGEVFDCTRCADETQSKPHPQMLYEILDELQVQAQNSLMIGDSTYDMEMAMHAQVPAIAVTYGVHEATALKRYHPKEIVQSVEELRRCLLPTYATH